MSHSTTPSQTVPSDKEERIKLAIAAIHASGTKPDGVTHDLSFRAAAANFDVPRSTLQDRFDGLPTRAESHEHQQALAPAQEQVLVEWAQTMGRRGVPLSHRTLTDHASDIAGRQLGESWAPRFLARHPELKKKWTERLEKARARNVNPTLIAEFYDVYEDILRTHDISPSSIYNMDEKGIQLGVGRREKVFVDRDQKDVYSIEVRWQSPFPPVLFLCFH